MRLFQINSSPFARAIAWRSFALGVLIAILGSDSVLAQSWKKIGTFDGYICLVKFLDANTGFVGLGISPGKYVSSPSPVELDKTTDGGKTWIKTSIPSGYGGEIGDILMVDSLNGWLAMTAWGGGNSALWRTTDAGMTWNETPLAGSGTSVEITPSTMIVTDIIGNGHISTDGGNTFSDGFLNSTNCVNFVDPLHGVISDYRGENWLNSSDGGRTWQNSNMNVESWSVYPDTGTSNFYAAPEGPTNGQTRHLIIYHSSDYGDTWGQLANFPFISTGHLTGIRNQYLFFQVQDVDTTINGVNYGGFYYSTDQGVTWTNIGGPSAFNDTRFSVLNECLGIALYGFDDQSPGSVFQYSFGSTNNNSTMLSLPEATQNFLQKSCSEPVDTAIPIAIAGCLPPSASLDSVWLTGSQNFTISDSRTAPRTLDAIDSILVRYARIQGMDTAELHIRYDFGLDEHDTTIQLIDTVPATIGAGVTLSLYFKSSTITTHPGDTLEIPVYLSGNTTLDTTSITLSFGIDTNVLRPIGFRSEAPELTNDTIIYSNGTMNVPLQSDSIALKGEKLIGYLRCIVYLADTLATTVTLQNASLTLVDAPCVTLSLITDSVNILINGCGDQTLLQFMKEGQILLEIQSITPNPAMDVVGINFINPSSSVISYQVVDVLGTVRLEGKISGSSLTLDMQTFANGLYYLRAQNVATGSIASGKFVVER